MNDGTVRLLDYIVRVCPQWSRLSRLEKSLALQSIIPRLDIAATCTKETGLDGAPTVINLLKDVHVLLEDHYTCIHTRTLGRMSMFRYAKSRLGYAPDIELPLIGSSGSMVHVLESLIVV